MAHLLLLSNSADTGAQVLPARNYSFHEVRCPPANPRLSAN